MRRKRKKELGTWSLQVSVFYEKSSITSSLINNYKG